MKSETNFNTSQWHEFNLGNHSTLEDYLTIIEDATSMGFEFKVENHKVYWREIDPCTIG